STTALAYASRNGRRQSQAKLGLPVMRIRPRVASLLQPTSSTLSSMPGIERAAPERTDTSKGLRRWPKRNPVASSRNAIPSLRQVTKVRSASLSPALMAAPSAIGNTKAGGTGRPSSATRARIDALAPISSGLPPSPPPALILTILTSAPFLVRKPGHHLVVQDISNQGHAVARPLERAGKLEHDHAPPRLPHRRPARGA